MSKENRRFLDSNPATPTFIGANSAFVGNIRGVGQFVVSGEVHGDGELGGALNPSGSGSWHAHVRPHQALIDGNILGGLTAKDRIEIGYTGVIRGKVSARAV